jgi:hypothetical protein
MGLTERQMIQGRWWRIAAEAEITTAMARDRNVEIIEWGPLGQTFIISFEHLIIVRTGILGGDVREIHGGFVYDNEISLRLDLEEIRQVAREVHR